jgi:hypothetical protein
MMNLLSVLLVYSHGSLIINDSKLSVYVGRIIWLECASRSIDISRPSRLPMIVVGREISSEGGLF